MAIEFSRHGDLLINPAYLDVLREAGMSDLDTALNRAVSDVLSKPSLASWRKRSVLRLPGQNTLYIKTYHNPPMWSQLSRFLRGYNSEAHVEWTWITRLLACGLSVPIPIAFGRRGWSWYERESILVTAPVPGQSLESLVASPDRKVPDQSWQTVADTINVFHRRGYCHKDLYLSHVFFDDSQGVVSLIDLQRVFKPRWRRRRWIVKDLAALNYSTPTRAMSTTQRMRWFRRYLGRSRLSQHDKQLWYDVSIKTSKISRHSRKHNLG